MKGYSYTSSPPMGRTACKEPQCLYNGALYRTACTEPQCLYNGALYRTACTEPQFLYNSDLYRTACTEPQCLYNGAIYFLLFTVHLDIIKILLPTDVQKLLKKLLKFTLKLLQHVAI
jgi:hypothetical protein